jgi:tRNA threonylcarbamoyl adenosine modification protein YeaZ
VSGSGLSLLLDLSHAGFAAVLDADGNNVLARSARPQGTRHDDVADWTEGLLREAGGGFSDVRSMFVGVGPGSFTGIRIAMAFVQGLALPKDIPLHGFTSFEALFLSWHSGRTRPAIAAVPANAGRFYVARAIDDTGALISAEALSALADSETVVIAPETTDALLFATLGFGGVWNPQATWDAVAIAQHALASGRGADRPVYLQLSAAEEKASQASST